jgi:hypothetical protein
MLFAIVYLRELESSWVVVAITIVGEIQAFFFFFWIDCCLRI